MGYSTGLLDCFSDCGTCCDVCFCFSCNLSRQCNAADGTPNDCGCCFCIGACIFPTLSACILRQKVTSKYSLGEGACCACLAGCCCTGCSVCQTHRELTLHGANPGGCCCQPHATAMQ
ncbi:uncharacterized protein Tco025E_08369 [Trypanosoma conorhini]|uniref:Uncharacterized protein n=1 Tax=Trypanosoma conorhini TaxID=83891 RepID=A0A3R7MHF8_9TRYP|nr:uncharacterized protein Tco025E_08369 [Trypanosoma conorhini]RNF02553.1 hypothetical protein Tco025E_08369 [Trypanosoma conorhini]